MTPETHRKTRMWRYRLALLGLATALTGTALVGCNRGGDAAAKQKAVPASATEQAILVSVSPVRVGSISNVADVTGALNTLNDVTVGVKIAGKVSAVYVREGDLVRAGQIVAEQDKADLQAQLEQQSANLESAKTRLDQAKVAYKNAQITLTLTDEQTKSAIRQAQAGLVSAQQQAVITKKGARQQELEQSEQNVLSAKANRDKARADLKRYQDLYRQQAIAAQQLDQAQAAADSADAAYNSAVQALSLMKEGNRPEDIRRAEASVEQARQTLVTAQANRQQVDLRRADVETARVGIETAEASVKQAQAALDLAKQGLSDADIRSPIDGVVAERKVEPGMQLGAGKDVARIVSLQHIYFDAQLSATQYAQVQSGMLVKITVDALPGRSFQGHVSKIYPVASSTARSFTVRIDIANEGYTLRPQMFARGQIVLDTHSHALLIPRDAVLDFSGSGGSVFIAVTKPGEDKPVAEKREVKIGFTTFREVEVTSGLKEGDKVVTAGQGQLDNGSKLQIEAATASAAQ